jgi:hypothetical protein
MNFQQFASKIAKREGLKKQVSVGNIREVLRITLEELAQMPYGEVATLLRKYQRKEAITSEKKRKTISGFSGATGKAKRYVFKYLNGEENE